MSFGQGEYRGARFYKCDLQMQTPEDARHWVDDACRLAEPRQEQDLQEKARQYLRRCYEVGLEVIGVTDHNFSNRANEREWFLTHLMQQNRTVAREMNRNPLVIFPGFELDIGYHVLCLFEPETPLMSVSECLTTLGLPVGQRFQNGRLKPCRSNNQNMSLDELLRRVQEDNGGIIIAAHAFSTNGIAASGRDADDYRDERLLVVEVNDVPLTGRAKGILEAKEGSWCRRRPPAYIMSSDCKKLTPAHDNDQHYIGWRQTWIKMSQPSITALRQAFLDQAHQMRAARPEESRIRFGNQLPEEAYIHTRIRRIQVQGAAFLSDQTLGLSPNLNTLIGGRGTGKSTLVEYLRVALDQERNIQGKDAQDNFYKIQKTIRPGTSIQVEIEKAEQVWTIESMGGVAPRVISGSPVPDIALFFPVRIFSQREIYAISENRESRSRLIDNLIGDALADVQRKQEDLTREIRSLNVQLAHTHDLKKRRQTLETEKLDYQTRLTRLKQLEEPLRRWRGLLAERDFLEALDKESQQVVARARDMLEQLELASTVLGSELRESPNKTMIGNIAEQANRLLAILRQSMDQILTAFEKGIVDLLKCPEVSVWYENFASARQDYERLKDELATQGIDPDQYLAYQNQVRAREVELKEVEKRLQGLEDLRHQREGKIKQLVELWKRETSLRKEIAQRLTVAVPQTRTGQAFVQVTIESFGDDRAFAEKMQDVVKDWRRVSREDWGYFDHERKQQIVPEDSFLAAVIRATPSEGSPMDVFLEWIEALRAGRLPGGCPWQPQDRRTETILGWLGEAEVEELRLWRSPDRVRVELFRQDGTRAGELEEGLSVGQRCTAILALLLAQDEAPVIIDQPEDDLDNEFIYDELVPLLRRVKETRQLIIATHNANIPVNGDAELIVALEARQGRGDVKRVDGQEALGALDREAVRLAVEEIMEGSEEAFRRRSEKYGF